MSKKSGIVTSILSAAALVLSAVALVVVCMGQPDSHTETPVTQTDAQTEETDIQYVLYLGTNGKDTNQPVFTPEEAKKQAEKILIEHFGGYTIQEASGGWIDNGTEYQEYTLVIYLSDTDIDSVHKAAKEMIRVFDQSSVLIQANRTTTEFYDGK